MSNADSTALPAPTNPQFQLQAVAENTPDTLVLKAKLARKIVAVMADVGNVPKDKTNDFHKYKYISDEAIVGAIRAALIKHGLAILPSQESMKVEEHPTKNKDEKTWFTAIAIEYEIVDIDTGFSVRKRMHGQGKDKEEKGLYKATTGAEKYFLMKTFLISTGDDPEKDDKNGRPQNQQQGTNTSTQSTASVQAKSVVISPLAIHEARNKNGVFWKIDDVAGDLYYTFDQRMADTLRASVAAKGQVRVSFVKTEKDNKKIVSAQPLARA